MPALGFAYEQPTHEELSQKGLEASDIAKPNGYANLGLALPINDSGQKFKNSHGDSRTIVELIRDGANFEDDGDRSLNHFFDPVYNRPLTVWGAERGKRSPDWALEQPDVISAQEFSLRDARDYLYKALTLPAETDRKQNFGRLFETLGHVIHHLQDMAQPQHVRNDAHCGEWYCALAGLKNPSLYEKYTNKVRGGLPFTDNYYNADTKVVFGAPRDFWTNGTGSGMAQFTNWNFVSAGTNFTLLGGAASPSAIYATPVPSGTYPEYIDDLFKNAGIALPTQCTEPHSCIMVFYANDVTDNLTPGASGTNYRASTQSIFDQDLQITGKTVTYTDPNTGQAVTTDRLFSLNRFNFDAAHQFLIPRAVGYSAGLLNYFFRGRLQISLPDEGVYAVVDHSVEKQGKLAETDTTYGGFRKINLKVQNVTPDPAGQNPVEPMSGGKLVAVAKFHYNTCYQPDLSGEYGAPGKDWNVCRSKEEQIVVSNPLDAPAEINTSAKPLTFTFQTPIPINASDLYLQVVYRGTLGQETDAVVVATKDISEPTFKGFYNTFEQNIYNTYRAFDTLGHTYTYGSYCPNGPYATCYNDNLTLNQYYIAISEYCSKTTSLTCIDNSQGYQQHFARLYKAWRFSYPKDYQVQDNPLKVNNPTVVDGSFKPVVEMKNVDVSRYTRVAILADPGFLTVYFAESPLETPGSTWDPLGLTYWNGAQGALYECDYNQVCGYPQPAFYGMIATRNKLDPATNTMTPTPYKQARGVYLISDDYWILTTGSDYDPATGIAYDLNYLLVYPTGVGSYPPLMDTSTNFPGPMSGAVTITVPTYP